MEIFGMPGHLIRRLNQIATGLFMDHMARAGHSLTPVQYGVLSALTHHPGSDQATIAGLVAYDRATLGRVLDRMEARGLVARAVSLRDRRAKVLTLTEAGTALYQAVRPRVEALQPDILTGLTPEEQRQFRTLLDKVTMAGNSSSRAPWVPPDPDRGDP